MLRKLDLVKKLLHRCGADVNATNNGGLAPLHYVVKNSHKTLAEKYGGELFKVAAEEQEEIAHTLLAAGAAVDLQDKKGRTALHIAAMGKDVATVQLLLQHGAKPDIQNSEGMTPLHHLAGTRSCMFEKLDETLVKLLIEKGADLEAKKDHLTPLHLAVNGGLLNIVKLLVEAGADIHAETPNTGLTPLDMAEHGRNQDIIDYLTTQEKSQRERNKREEASVEQEVELEESQKSDTPVEWIELLEEGAVGGFEQVLVIEQEEEEDSDESLHDVMYTYMKFATMSQELRNAISFNDVVKLQKIFCTTDVKLNDYCSYNPLIHACIKGSPVIVGALAKAGSDVNVKADISNYSPYKSHASARLWNAIECMKTVTPLILAVVDRNFKLVKKLVQDCGADVNATNEDGTAPLHHVPTNAKERKCSAIVESQKKIADLLLKAGVEVNVHNKNGETPLHRAAVSEDLQYSRKLLQNRARVDLVDKWGFTVLHIAAEQADCELLKLLMQQEGTRALVNQKTHDDTTPLHVAITAKADTRKVAIDLERRKQLQATRNLKTAKEEGRPKRESPSAEQAQTEDKAVSQQTDTPVPVEEVLGAVGGFQEALVIKDGDTSSTNLPQPIIYSIASCILIAARMGSELYQDISSMETVTPLIVAVATRNLKLVKKLLHVCGANVNAKNEDGTAPLHCISTNRFDQESLKAKQQRHNLTAALRLQSTTVTVNHNHDQVKQEIANLLLAAGAEVNACDKKGQTPLHKAATAKDAVTAQILLGNGARLDIADNKRSTPLHIAASVADGQLCRLLIQQEGGQALVNKKTKGFNYIHDNATPLQRAIAAKADPQEKMAVVRLLIDNGAEVTCQTNMGLTLLHLAAEAGPPAIVKMLVEAGADIHVEAPRTGLTPVDMAEHTGQQDIVDYLVAKAAEHEAKLQAAKKEKEGGPKRDSPSVEQAEDNEGSQQTVTHNMMYTNSTMFRSSSCQYKQQQLRDLREAISNNNLQKIQEILYTANVDLNYGRDYNPLLHACYEGYPVVAGALVKAGADVNARVRFRSIGEGTKIRYSLRRALELVEGIETVTPLILGVVDRKVDIVRKLVQDCNADVNATNATGLAPLHCISTNTVDDNLPAPARAQRKQEITDLLLKAGAEVNVYDRKANTPLHYAAMANDPVSTRVLLQNGATVDITNREGCTPLHVVCQTKDYLAHIRDVIAVVKLLIDNGAKLNSQKHGLTPLHLAAEAGLLNVVKVLVTAGADIHPEAPVTGLTPLDMAVNTKKQDVVDYLIARKEELERRKQLQAIRNLQGGKKGGRPKREAPSAEQAETEDSAASQQTDTPVEEMVEGAVGGFQQVLVIEEGDSSDEEDSKMAEELWDAIASNDLQRVQRVLCTNEDIDLNTLYSPTTDDYCENVATTYLLWACKTSSPEVVSALVTVGADVNASAYLVDEEAPDSWRIEHETGHVTPLIYAVKRRKIELVRKLLQTCQADPDATNGEGRTALHYVVEPMSPAEDWHSLNPTVAKDATGAREDIAVLLLQAGVKLYLADQKGNTPLHIAAANVDVPICKILLSPIGQVSVRTGMQVSPLQNDGGTPMHSAIESGGRDEEIACIVEMLAQKGADLKARKFGLTPLHLAAQNGLLLTVRKLVEAGADVEAKAARTGLTPLDMARHAYKKTVAVYLECGELPEDTEYEEETFDNSTAESAPQSEKTPPRSEEIPKLSQETTKRSQETTEAKSPSQISVWTVARPELGETREEFEGRVSFGKKTATPSTDDSANFSTGSRKPSTDWSVENAVGDTASDVSTLTSVTEEPEKQKSTKNDKYAMPPRQSLYTGSRKSSVDGSLQSFAEETASSVSTLVLGSVKERGDLETQASGQEDSAMPQGRNETLPFQLAALQNGSTKTESVVSSASHTTDRSHHKKHRKPARLKNEDILSMDEKMDILLQTLGDIHLQMAKMTKRISKLETERKSEVERDGHMGNGQ
ncbi:uncharacterized protein LOC118405463 [Branchiostoma floridae]|uniref:Uncharacterized protein LOC118405463 n=1 Tax=Branchiostoma floridae TaxID=7739 RepID=A0A9J7HP78_BRAFL|nr:uncharacterized protein LOC118405463 [Branchiostoma floridae]